MTRVLELLKIVFWLFDSDAFDLLFLLTVFPNQLHHHFHCCWRLSICVDQKMPG